MANFQSSSRSPPPLQHPVPTHPAFIPEPPSTPNSPQGYMRFSSSPSNQSVPPANFFGGPQQGQQQHAHPPSGYGSSQFQGYTPASGHGQQHGQQHVQQHGQQHGQQPNQPLPQGIDLAQWGVNPVTAQLGMQFGQNAVAAGQEYMQKNVWTACVISRAFHS